MSTPSPDIPLALLVPGLPHPLLDPDGNAHRRALRDAFDAAAAQIAAVKPDVLLVYSTMWPSIIGHQVVSHPEPTWRHVDELFHALGTIAYRFPTDPVLAQAWVSAGHARGLAMRTVDDDGFPVDTGSVVALELLDPEHRVPALIGSSNVYADRAETIVYAKAARDALAASGKRAVAIVVSTLSNRLFTDWVAPEDDRIHSAKDDEWNRKLLEMLEEGRVEDVAQLSRTIHGQLRVKKVVNFKPMWFLSALMGAHNHYDGEVLAYAPVHGTGCAVVTLRPSADGTGDREFDEDDVEVWTGNREVLDPVSAAEAVEDGASVEGPVPEPVAASNAGPVVPAATDGDRVDASEQAAPRPVGAYPHARRVGDFLYVSGMGPRQPGTDEIPGGPIRDGQGRPLDYDAAAQTEAVIGNIRRVLEEAGASLEDVVDCQCFLVDMDRDFPAFNKVYAKHFAGIGPTRTTVAVRALPTPIAVEFKVVAHVPRGRGA